MRTLRYGFIAGITTPKKIKKYGLFKASGYTEEDLKCLTEEN